MFFENVLALTVSMGSEGFTCGSYVVLGSFSLHDRKRRVLKWSETKRLGHILGSRAAQGVTTLNSER